MKINRKHVWRGSWVTLGVLVLAMLVFVGLGRWGLAFFCLVSVGFNALNLYFLVRLKQFERLAEPVGWEDDDNLRPGGKGE